MTKDEQNETVARAQRLGLRAMQLAVGSLIVVILVLTISLGVTLNLARIAQNEAQTLQTELTCQSEIATVQQIAKAELNVSIAEALAKVGRSQPITSEIVEEIESKISILREANEERRKSVENCSEG